jgi:hypothetical protein
MSGRAITYAEEQGWRRAEHDLFRRIGEVLRDVIPSSAWCELDIDDRRRCIETAVQLLRRDLGLKATDTASLG